MMLIGEKLNGFIKSTAVLIERRNEKALCDLAVWQEQAGAD